MQEGSQQIYLLDCLRKQDINLHLGASSGLIRKQKIKTAARKSM
jgi:hypothetical protein